MGSGKQASGKSFFVLCMVGLVGDKAVWTILEAMKMDTQGSMDDLYAMGRSYAGMNDNMLSL